MERCFHRETYIVVQKRWHSSGATAADNDRHGVELCPWQKKLGSKYSKRQWMNMASFSVAFQVIPASKLSLKYERIFEYLREQNCASETQPRAQQMSQVVLHHNSDSSVVK